MLLNLKGHSYTASKDDLVIQSYHTRLLISNSYSSFQHQQNSTNTFISIIHHPPGHILPAGHICQILVIRLQLSVSI